MKRLAVLLFSMIVVIGVTVGCTSQQNGGMQEGKVNVMTSFFPLYDFARVIGGEHVHVINLIPAGVDPHDWSPKSRDMMNISKAQMFIYQGAGFEGWTKDVLSGVNPEEIILVEASRGIELMAALEEGHKGEHEEEEEHAEEGAVDPHTWLSPRSALRMAENIFIGMKQADPDHAAEYEANYEALEASLTTLDQAFTKQLAAASNKEMVVSHQAFGYLARDYGLIQMPIMGITPDGEPTAQDIKIISEFVKEHGVAYIFTEELVSDQLAKTLANDLGVQTLPLHPLEGLTESELAAGETYISLMEKNLANLVKALQ